MLYKYISILTFLFLNLIYSQSNSEYIIFTTSEYEEAANLISELHSSAVPEQYQLITEIIYLDEFEWYDTNDSNLNTYIREEIKNQESSVRYLLLLGNEIAIPPIYITALDGTLQPSDDFYSCEDTITTFNNLENFVPQISTGRISVNNINQANQVANKLYKYMVEPTYGVWRTKIGLIADDENKDGYSSNELNHTINSDNIYQNLSSSLNISQFYGLNYESIENGSYITKPEMTSDVINYINQGASLINYIGHGSETTLGSEKIIDMGDLNNICNTETPCNFDSKHAIWVVGTCSFGKYDESDEIMSEKLLFNEFGGAISLITTSRGIGAYANSVYLNNLFDNINEFILNNNDNRLGDVIRESKRTGKNTEYLFHLLGDPGLILPFPKIDVENVIINSNDILENGFEIMKNITDDLYDNGLNNSFYEEINISLVSEEISFEDAYPDTTITYILKGNQIHAGIVSENTCINIPLDIETCINCSSIDMALFSDTTSEGENLYNGNIQIIKNIPVYLDNNFENDGLGPEISLFQGEVLIKEGSFINKDVDLTIVINDEQGINFMDDIQHNVRYWFNDNNYIYNINSDRFEYEENVCGKVSANFSISDSGLDHGTHDIYVEAWDNGNNRTLLKYSFILEDNKESYVNNLYNFPNPFRDDTFFTFYLSKYPADVEINIYTINGRKIKTIQAYCDNYYNSLKWNGKTDTGRELGNGPYIYSFKSNYKDLDGVNHIFESINKIAKLK